MSTAVEESVGTRANRIAAMFHLCGDSTRMQVLMLLAERERNVTELCQDLGNLSQPGVSHHLALLRVSGLVDTERRAKFNYYTLTESGASLVAAAQLIINGKAE